MWSMNTILLIYLVVTLLINFMLLFHLVLDLSFVNYYILMKPNFIFAFLSAI